MAFTKGCLPKYGWGGAESGHEGDSFRGGNEETRAVLCMCVWEPSCELASIAIRGKQFLECKTNLVVNVLTNTLEFF